MKMKTIFFSGVVCAAMMTAFGAEAETNQLSVAERFMKRTGGMVENRKAVRGKVVYLDACAKTPEGLAAAVAEIRNELLFDISVEKGSADDIAGSRAKYKATVVVAVIDEAGKPTLLAAPEERWASVNVRALKADDPSPEVFERRFKQELWRAFGFACGLGSASFPCVMNNVGKLADLDAKRVQTFSPDTMIRLQAAQFQLGLAPAVRTTYRQACRLGWAPAPTNEYQRVIWDAVKEEMKNGPSKPIKIERGKPLAPKAK